MDKLKLKFKAPRLFVKESFLVDVEDVELFEESKIANGFKMVECAIWIEDNNKRVVTFEKWNNIKAC